MKTRAEIYGHEAAELLRIISLYPGLSGLQLCRFFPDKEDKAATLLSHMKRQGRIIQSGAGSYVPYGFDIRNIDTGLVQAVWILLDFMEQVEYHSSSDFPVKLIFFANSELYEIVYTAAGQETLVSHALDQYPREAGRRIILVDKPEQIDALHIPGTSGYCTVSSSGYIQYYKKQKKGEM